MAGVRMELDRVLAPSWVARRVLLEGVVQDERVTAGLGKGTAACRARIAIVLRGRLEATVGGRARELSPGDFLLAPCLADVVTASAGDEEVIEIDWDPGTPMARATAIDLAHGRLAGASLAAATSIGAALAESGTGAMRELARVLPEALRALAAEGLPFDPSGAEFELAQPADAGDQRYFESLDQTFMQLGGGPAVVDLEERLGWSRRTVSRRTAEVHARYGISGSSGESFRSVRDFYRMLVGTILATHPDVTTRTLAVMLGYGSPDALCHAFANAGLPSPGALKKLPRAA